MKNTIFQFIYYRLVKWVIPRKGKNKIEKQYYRYVVQFKLARLFSSIITVFIGDSNAAGFGVFKIMKLWKTVTVNFGVGGTTAIDWINFFKTMKGQKILTLIIGHRIVLNIGGNHIILNQMETAAYGLHLLHDLFPDSYNCTVPPINTVFLANISKLLQADNPISEDEYNNRTLIINSVIKLEWKDHSIDCHSAFLNLPFVLKDMVHYYTIAMKCIIKYFNEIVYARE